MKNELQISNTTTQTPIEISLQIDEDGMTTASNLYGFLELHPAHFSDWCRRNIRNNKFATETFDYFPFTIQSERHNPKPKTDYKLTADFAKKLSMTGNSEKHEQAREYFIACEQGLKIATEKLSKQNITTESRYINLIEKVTETLTSLNTRLERLEKISETKELTMKKPYNPWFAKMSPKYALLEDYFKINRGKLYSNILKELENLYDIDTQQIQADYLYANNLQSCYPLEPYEYKPEYRDMIEQIVNTNLIKYGIASKDDPIVSNKHITIFDTPVK